MAQSNDGFVARVQRMVDTALRWLGMAVVLTALLGVFLVYREFTEPSVGDLEKVVESYVEALSDADPDAEADYAYRGADAQSIGFNLNEDIAAEDVIGFRTIDVGNSMLEGDNGYLYGELVFANAAKKRFFESVLKRDAGDWKIVRVDIWAQ